MSKKKLVVNEDFSAVGYANLNKQREEGFLCDIELVVEGKQFPAHKNVLAAGSDYFTAMFGTNMRERYADNVELKEVTCEAVRSILDYIYCGKIELSEENVQDILQAASIMQITGLLDSIDNYFMDNIDLENLVSLKTLSDQFSLVCVQHEVEKCIHENFETVCQSKSFWDLSCTDLEKYFLSDEIKVQSEDTLFNALTTWINHDLEARKKDFLTLFKAIRLQFVSKEFLSNTIRKHNLVKENSSCRDLVEDAMHFHIQPELFQAQKQRSCVQSPIDEPYQSQTVQEERVQNSGMSTEDNQPSTSTHNTLPNTHNVLVPQGLQKFASHVVDIPNDVCKICTKSLAEEPGFKMADKVFCHVIELKQCKHKVHGHCAAEAYEANNKSLTCPQCNKVYTVKRGNQPPGQMYYTVIHQCLPGYRCYTISIEYEIGDGIQDNDHPNPGQPYYACGFPRKAYLPDNEEGRKVLKLLQVAWERRLIFTIGHSISYGRDNCVTWSEIQHKTKMGPGTYGYPDPAYLINVLEDLKAQGITEEDIN